MPLVLKVLLRVSASVTFRHSIQGHEIPLPTPLCFSTFQLPQLPPTSFTAFLDCLGSSILAFLCVLWHSVTLASTRQLLHGVDTQGAQGAGMRDRAGLRRTFIANYHPWEDGEHSNGPRKARKQRLAKQPPKKPSCIRDTFEYKKYLKFLNDKRYHKLRKQRAEWGGIFLTQVADKR